MRKDPTKERLSAILKHANLKPLDKQAFEDMWDAIHRYGRLSHRQSHWIDSVFFEQKLDKPGPKTAVKGKVGFVIDPRMTQIVRVTTLEHYEQVCPHVPKGSPQWEKVASFLKDPNNLVEIKPK